MIAGWLPPNDFGPRIWIATDAPASPPWNVVRTPGTLPDKAATTFGSFAR